MRVGELAKSAGVSGDTIRLYESMGLLRATRGRNGYREFPEEARTLVALIRQAQRLGFRLAELQSLIHHHNGRPDWTGIQDTLADEVDGQVSIFQGLEPAEIARLIEMSPVINCGPGDKIISQDVADRTVFVVLDGAVEVHRDGAFVALLPRGSVFGEVAFLLGRERTADVVAATEARVISLRERALNELIASESKIAARFLLNLARIVCLKLAEREEDDVPVLLNP